MKYARTACRGFTLVELMITLTIAAILAFLAIPSLTAYKRNAELTSAANTLLAAINAARGEAMKRGMNAMVVPTDGVNWSNGWVVFVDKDRSQTYTNNLDSTVLTQPALPAYITVIQKSAALGTGQYVLYDASGYSKTKLGAPGALSISLTRSDLTGSTLTDQTRRIMIALTGRARICKPTGQTGDSCVPSNTF